MPTIVNSWNEWDPLKHIIVGRADGTMVQAPEPAVVRDWPEYGFPLGTYGPLPKDMEGAHLDGERGPGEGRGQPPGSLKVLDPEADLAFRTLDANVLDLQGHACPP